MRLLPRCTTIGCSEKSILLFSPYFTTLSVVVRVCIKKPVNKGFSFNFALWNISDASVGTEELSHVEMLSAMYTQLICDVPVSELVAEGMAGSKFQHGCCPFPADANGYLWTSAYIGTTGDPVADITNDMAAEEKARAGYEGALRQCSDPDVAAALQFLREREIVHFQRFGEALNYINEQMGCRKYF